MGHVRHALGTSERRACQALGQPRSTQRYQPRQRLGEAELVKRMLALSARNPRFGYRRVWSLLRREGFDVNRKRVQRLWRLHGLKVPRRRRRKRAAGQGGNGCAVRRVGAANQVWAWDFVHDRTTDGRTLKWLSVVDEFTRECVVLEVRRSFKAVDVIEAVSQAMRRRGAPACIRSDNGPEFIARALRRWLGRAGVETLYVAPGSPWQNGYAESFHARLSDELLEQELWTGLAEARLLTRRWQWSYNVERPHSALGYRTPAEYAATRSSPEVGAPPLPPAWTAQEEPTLIAPGT